MPRVRQVLPLLLALALGACDIQTLWGGESAADRAEQAAAAEARRAQVLVPRVHSVEIGRTRDGVLVTAHGTAPGPGYALPTLRPRRDGLPGFDGYIDYDFVATPPPAGLDLPPGTPRNLQLRADTPLSANTLRGAAGIRVHGQVGGAQLDLGPGPRAPAG